MIRLQILFEVADRNAAAFERMYSTVYQPALRRQEGFAGSHLLRAYPAAVRDEIGAARRRYNYQIELTFETEELRRRWASSAEHEEAWSSAVALFESTEFAAYDDVAADADDRG